jgi:transketolase
MHIYVPCFDEDVAAVIHAAQQRQSPCYIRLGRGELPTGERTPAYQPWRQLLAGAGAIIIATGPIAGMVWATCRDLPVDQRPNVWVVSELPLTPDSLPATVTAQIASGTKLIVVEEHISHGGLAQMMLYYCATHGIPVGRFHSLHAAGIAIGVYGSQTYLRQHSQLTPAAVRSCLGIYE